MGWCARPRRLAVLLLAKHAPPAVLGADSPHRSVSNIETGSPDFVGEEPVPELGVITMRVEDGVRQPRFIKLSFGEWLVEPPVILLAAQVEDPARHRHGNPVIGKVTNDREHYFGGRFACDK